MKTDLKSEEVLSFLRFELVNFDSVVDVDDGIYDALGDFAIYLRNAIAEESLSEEYLRKAFEVLNTMGASKDLEVHNLLVVGILEILADEDQVVIVVKDGLVGYAAELFENVLKGWNSG